MARTMLTDKLEADLRKCERHRDKLREEVVALRAAGDALQSAYSRLAEWAEWVKDRDDGIDRPVPYEVLMDACGSERLVEAWTEARRAS